MSEIINARIAHRNRLAHEARTMRTFFWPLPIKERNTLVQQFISRANPGSLNPHKVLEEAHALTRHAHAIHEANAAQRFTPEQYAAMQEELTQLHEQANELQQWAQEELTNAWIHHAEPTYNTQAASN